MIREFIYKYYIDPIRFGQPYNIVDTLTYAAILIIAVYLLYRWSEKSHFSIDGRMILATIPYVVLGGLLRVVEDTDIITTDIRFLLITPLIFFVVFGITVSILIVSRVLQSHGVIRDYIPLYTAGGIISCIIVAGILLSYGADRGMIAWNVMAVIIFLAAITSMAVYGVMRYALRWEYASDPLYKVLIFGQMLDASATSYGIDLHPLDYMEVHVVGSNLIEWTGTAFVMFPLKLAVLFPGIYILERFRHEGAETLWHLIVLAMIVVGLAPGVRDMMRMVLYV